ncbi:hypothetical protein [Pseudoalteromonas tunicata]|jgi:hypothetical protein|uniref:Porin domain-containing protein n=1 Tax=Pseudoalteromonas tunicata D2 TaxID=87626 RepID=A4C5D2_9GAMM|nr:hypothetical protein [Pseudoalteromonas tunicata]ATC96763.1 hypothetical protein PTUN_b0363 [Pseudoalteromonas tunicata]EAR30764.1 hypothetical protein PTD2_04306 [Pseudoalteromonas tunicata D2]MDP4984334.1 hypothetical protein [Pseudoalteromonas tunicata]MDP5214701.1 hypothetical protein [Pseudoalteromonas tunicata]
MKHFNKTLLALIISGSCVSHIAQAEVSISGFGSIVAGKTLGTVEDPLKPGTKRDEIFTADFYDVGQYSNDFTFEPETVFALQISADMGDKLKVTGQLVAKGTDDFRPELDWYYLTYQATNELTLMVGRRNIPMYYFSEFSEVGYAYPWMRPPSNLYWWQVTQFNGFTAMYDFDMGGYSNTVSFFYGNEYSNENKEMNYYDKLYGGNARAVNEFWTDIVGMNWNLSGDFFNVRFVYFQNDRDRETIAQDGSIADYTPFSQQFLGLGGNVDLANFTVLFDMNMVKYDDIYGTEFPTYLVSLVYHMDQFHPYISYSKADQKRTKRANEEDYEEHYLLSYGVRYDFHQSASLKLQYDKFVDQGDKATGWAYHGDSDTITVGVDFIF